ncbi:MAG TPA: DUF4407 domain-containing protein [Chitinophagaceae bacterium]|nr:DUF4407 domain-containing protein [Chitinophagaceae bacterium]
MTAINEKQAGDLYDYASFGGKSRSEGHFLWFCAGAQQTLLKRFPTEHSKYSGLGAVILATFVLAALSSGYAVYTVFGNIGWSIAFALIWGLIIFNLDRFLVSTMRKYGVSRRKQFYMALPRMGLALLIGITIARPLELKIFEKEIDTRVQQNMHHKMQLNDSLLRVENASMLANAGAERDRFVQRKQAIEDSLNHLQKAYVEEADGTGGSGRRGIEALTRLKQAAYEQALQRLEPERALLNTKISKQDSLLAAAAAGMQERQKVYESNLGHNVGFLERNKALSDLSSEEGSVFWTSCLLSLLFIMIEVGPVLSKLIMPVGPYDVELAKEELMQMAASENEMRRDKEMITEKKKAFYQQQQELSGQLVAQMGALQKKYIDQELDKWERGEWGPGDHRPSMDEVLRKIKAQYSLREENLL